MKVLDDKFTIRWSRNLKEWIVWLPVGHRYQCSGYSASSCHGVGGFETFDEARQYAVKRKADALKRGWRAQHLAAFDDAVLHLTRGRSA